MGGADRAAYRLHRGLRSHNCDSMMYVLKKESKDKTVVPFQPEYDFLIRLERYLNRIRIQRKSRIYTKTRPDGYEKFSDCRTIFGKQVIKQIPPSDVINLHWISNFIDLKSFFSTVKVPVVWTLHDMNAFTGGCPYDYGCGGYMQDCGRCPQLGSSKQNDLSRWVWMCKKRTYEQLDPKRLHIVTPSRWLAQEVARSTLLKRFSVKVIPNGLNIFDFAPRNQKYAREAIGNALDSKVVLFVANNVSTRRKGFTYLLEALKSIKSHRNLQLISIGGRNPEIAGQAEHVHLGNIESDHLLSVLYSAASLFVIPSIQDNLPNTVMESLACGTPVVGFNTGGIPDMVKEGVTGLLAPAQNVDALRDAIVSLLEDEERRKKMSVNCRRLAVEEYDSSVQAIRYLELYKEILE